MIITGNKAVADEGKYLKLEDTLKKEIYLGNNYIKRNGETIMFNVLSFNDIKEVYPVDINGVAYYISATSYGDIVSELIRCKYTLDLELAIHANYYLNKGKDEMNSFQEWRLICKDTAKRLINE